MSSQMHNAIFFNTYSLSERAISVVFGSDIDDSTLQQITQFNHTLHRKPFPGFYTTVPAYTTLTVFYDPLLVIQSDLPGTDCFDKVTHYLEQLKQHLAQDQPGLGKMITIPVCYGGTFGPDLKYVAASHGFTTDKVIDLHSSAIYKVYMIGFVPGFAYLGGMPEVLATPRLTTPRKAIPTGSVGIAGKQTGVYPLDTPGGWQLIGRTPLALFAASRSQPALLQAGDTIKFEPIPHHEFDLYRHHADTHH
ncbi:5-oxoprolinase subunit PxpB [Mucilaginibacter lacusdianchii]|uniref:5-oxoprolinase subunit PxpB n=1 Tax=Mucilaginibacter lacusdianchii TaxID=2684211 RepID=UPI001E2BCBD2|nr:5-oxoprolinase subunit PxpB [Mucilaginibacter sp. JXJ CY 39]